MEEIYLDRFNKLNQSAPPDLIEPTELSELTNGVLTKQGAFFKPAGRGGFSFSSILISLGGISNKNILGSWDFTNSEGVKIYVIAMRDGIVVYNVDVESSTSYPMSNISISNCIQLNDKTILLAIKNNSPMVIVDAFSGSPQLYPLMMPAPDIRASNLYITATGASQSLYVAYVITYCDADGNESIPSQKFGIYNEGNIATRTIHNIPVPTDSRVVSKKIYRTTIGAPNTAIEPSIFYYLTSIPANETTFTDSYGDDSLDYGKVVDYLTVIESIQTAALHKNRLFLGGITIRDFNPYKLAYLYGGVSFNPNTHLNYRGALLNSIAQIYTGFTQTGASGNEYTNNFPYYAVYFTTDSSKASIYPLNTNMEYRVYLKTADGRYSDYYYSFAVAFNADPYVGYKVLFKPNLLTAVFGAGKTPYPDWDTIEFWATSKTYNNKKRLIKTFKVTPALIMNGFNPDFIDLGQAEQDNIAAFPNPSAQPSYTYPSGILFSEPSEFSRILTGNKLMINAEDGGQIAGFVSEEDGLRVFKTSSQYKIFTEAIPSGWRLYNVSPIGAADDYRIATNSNMYFYWDGKYIRTLQDKIVSFNVTPTLTSQFASGYTMQRLYLTDKFLIVPLNKYSGGNIYNYILAIYDITLDSWYIWTYASYKTIGFVSNQTNEIDFDIVLYDNDSGKIIIANYVEGRIYDEYGGNVESRNYFSTVLQTAKFKNKDWLFRIYKVIVDITLKSGGSASLVVNNGILRGLSNGYNKVLIPDTANTEKKGESVIIKVIGDVDKLNSIKIVYNPVKGRYA